MLLAARTGNEKYPPLTGVRALGASIVFFDHFPFQPDAHITLNVMSFFFALSGFLIVRIYHEQAQISRQWLGKYFLNRFARIYPVYFLLLTVAVLLHHETRPWVLLTNYTLLHGLFHGTPFLIQPSWSLTVEECFYFLAPAFMLLARRVHVLVPLALGLGLFGLALGISTLDIRFLATPTFVLSTTFFGHFAEFFAGFYLALAVTRLEKSPAAVRVPGAWRTLAGVAGVCLLIGAMLVVYRSPHPDLRWIILINNFLIPFPIALLYWGLIREDTALARILASPLSGQLGRGSYTFYLLHTLVIDYLSIPFLLPLVGNRILCVLLTFVITWVASVLIFWLFEEPVNLFLRRKLRPSSASAQPQAAAQSARTA